MASPPKSGRQKGRPSSYKPEIAATICGRLAMGESLRTICAAGNMPAEGTVREWVTEDREGFSAQYARAREAQAHCLADEIIAIADDSSGDYVERTREDGSTFEAVDHEHIARSRLRVDARKWYASKLAPKVYGDKITQEHTGKNGGPIQTMDLSKATDEQLATLEEIVSQLAGPARDPEPGS